MASTEQPLSEADLWAAEALVVEAGWNQNAADWRIFLELGCALAVKEDGRLAATAATLPYPSGFGWISMVLVSRPYRRRGIATRLLERCIAMLREAGMVPVLDATPAGREVYRPLGFRDGWAITRWRAAKAKAREEKVNGVRPRLLEESHWPSLLALDAQAFGCDRGPLLERLRGRSMNFSCVIERESRLSGFLLGREGRVATQLGPVVAEDEDAARALVGFACARIGGPVLLDALDRHAGFARGLEAQGFARERPYTRMVLGREEIFGDPRRLAAIAGPELG
jgi:GNAT superfamily N-acetyltransferase